MLDMQQAAKIASHSTGNGTSPTFPMMAAGRLEQVAPCVTADWKSKFPDPISHSPLKPVAFVNGFQKRLNVYGKEGCREISDSESDDISNLEIDSNLSDSSNSVSPKRETRRPIDGIESAVNGKKIVTVFETINTTDSSAAETVCQNSNFCKLPSNLGRNVGLTVASPQMSATTNTTSKNHEPLVLKIRRRTWAHDEPSPKKAKPNVVGLRSRVKSASETLDSRQTVLSEKWQSVHIPPSTTRDEATNTEDRTTKSTITGVHHGSKRHHHSHHHRKSSKAKIGSLGRPTYRVSHQNGSPSQSGREHSKNPSHRKRKRKKSKDKSKMTSKTHPRLDDTNPGKTLRLPSDPQKAVKVLENALESINAQIRKLKRETDMEKKRTGKRKSGRGSLKLKKSKKKRLNRKANGKHSSGAPSTSPTVSHFKLSDFFSVVPSLIVRDNDLHPAYRTSVNPVQPPVPTHPIWRWKLGRPPLPKPEATPIGRPTVF